MPLDRSTLQQTWNENGHAMGPSHTDDTLVLPKMKMTPERATEVMAKVMQGTQRLDLIKEALDLLVELWPKPGYATVTLESHQWARLRRVLLSLPELVAIDE